LRPNGSNRMQKRYRIFGAGGLLVASAFLLSTTAFATPTVEAFGNLPAAEFARLSPDGKHLAIIKPYDGRNQVAFLDLTKANAAPYVVGMQDAVAENVYWKSNDRAICIFHTNLTQAGTKEINTWSRAVSVDPGTHAQVVLLHNAPYFKSNYDVGSIADMDADDPNHVYMTEVDWHDQDYWLDLYRVDLTTGEGDVVLHGGRDTIEFLMDGHGHTLGRVDQGAGLTNHVILGTNDAIQFRSDGSTDFEVAGVVAGSEPLLAIKKTTPYGTAGLYTWSSSGTGKALFENASYDFDGVIADERDGRVIGIRYVDDLVREKYFDPAMQRVQDALDKAYPGQTVLILSKDAAGSSYVILTEGPKNPPVLSLYTTADHEVNVIDEAYGALRSSDLGDVKPYPYKARDGIDIHAYLTLPPAHDAHNLPLVVLPHGGPEDRSTMSFDWRAQFLATRGYAVFQPNFRGSSGYGWNFIKAGDGEWAGKVQYDVQDGVKKLVADGIVDPRRICIAGASYGGYMALAGATFSPDLYACAISYAGPSDLDRMLPTGKEFATESVSLWNRRIGVDQDGTMLASQSPANFADRVKIPILLIHCDKDITVPIEQSEIEDAALKRAGKKVEFVKLEGDDHHLEYSATRIQFLQEIDRFLAANIGK
jgi:dipeptidyl aminopeptidase/acylaminoacyl peptidase